MRTNDLAAYRTIALVGRRRGGGAGGRRGRPRAPRRGGRGRPRPLHPPAHADRPRPRPDGPLGPDRPAPGLRRSPRAGRRAGGRVSGMARIRRNLLAFLVLNLLVEAPRHPYEMKRLIHWRGKDQLLTVNLDSLYHAIAQLERAALIEPVGTAREGRRPERTVYRANESGVDELRAWMRDLLVEPTNEFPRFIAALAHLPVLTPVECRELLERRAIH